MIKNKKQFICEQSKKLMNVRVSLRKQAGQACALGAALCLLLSVTAYAMPPYDHIPEGCSEETWNRMQDNLVEWDEIGDLVQYYNPAYTAAAESAGDTVTILQSAYADFVQDMRETLDETETTIDELESSQKTLAALPSGTVIPQDDGSTKTKEEALSELTAGLKEAKSGLSTAQSTINSSVGTVVRTIDQTEKTIEIQLLPAKKQLTQAIQSVMISHEQLAISRAMVEKQVSLYETMLATEQNLLVQGTATELEVQSAEASLAGAKASLQQVENGIESVRRAVGLQLGWDGETLPDLGEVPEPDADFVDTTNPDADKTAAIMHNSDLHTAGKVTYSSSYGYELRDKTENEQTGLLVAKMDSLYADMKEKKALWETAKTTLEKAQLTKDSAERMYRLGMLGRAEYEAQQLAYTSYEASYELARLNLFQSINNYQWAVDGYVSFG